MQLGQVHLEEHKNLMHFPKQQSTASNSVLFA